MTERVDSLTYAEPERSSTREPLETNLFLTQPGEYLVRVLVEKLKADEVWSALFGEWIDGYERMDYPMRSLPAMRIYNELWRKDFESWFVNGDLKIEIIWPPAIRRSELQRLPTTLSGAMLQQLRSQEFFAAMGELVPGLNELGKTVTADLTLGFQWMDDIVPLTQLTANFRIDLRAWDEYLESDYRTKDYPFERTLDDLKTIIGTIDGIEATNPEEVAVSIGWTVNDEPEPPRETTFFGFLGGSDPDSIGGFNEGVFIGAA